VVHGEEARISRASSTAKDLGESAMNQNPCIDESRRRWKTEFRGIPVLLLLLIMAMTARCEFGEQAPRKHGFQAAESTTQSSTVYVNKEYGFRFDLPQD
jgi:hypothetical protein